MEHRTRNIHVGTRLNNAEYEALKTLCKRTGLGSTRLLQKLITGTEIREKPTPELRDLQRSVDRIEVSSDKEKTDVNVISTLTSVGELVAAIRFERMTGRV